MVTARLTAPKFFGATLTPQVTMPNTTGWTFAHQGAGATATIRTDDPPYPGASYFRLNAPSGGNYPICRFDPNTLLTGNVGWWVRYRHFPQKNSNLLVLLATDTGGANNWFQTFPCGLGGNAYYLDGQGDAWRFYSASVEQMTGTTGTPSRNSAIRRVDFRLNVDGADTNIDLDVGPFYLNLGGRAKLLFGFDDGNITDYTEAFPYLSARGLSGTSYINPETIGADGNHLSLAQIREMDAAGWTIGSQSLNPLTAGSTATQLAELRSVQAYAGTAGISNIARHYAYGGGFYDTYTLSAMQTAGYKTARGAESRVFSPTGLGNELLNHPCVFAQASNGASTNVAALQSAIDRAITNRATLELGFHRLDEPASGQHYDLSDWKLVVDYAYLKQRQGFIDIVSKDAWYKQMLSGRAFN